jgi:hypothetical protein
MLCDLQKEGVEANGDGTVMVLRLHKSQGCDGSQLSICQSENSVDSTSCPPGDAKAKPCAIAHPAENLDM